MQLKSSKLSLIISLIIFVLVFGSAYLLRPQVPAKPVGIILPLTAFKSPIDPKTILQLPTYPLPQNPMARINVELLAPNLTNAAQMEAFNYAKQLAASIGATKIIIVFAGYSPELTAYEIQALAIG